MPPSRISSIETATLRFKVVCIYLFGDEIAQDSELVLGSNLRSSLYVWLYSFWGAVIYVYHWRLVPQWVLKLHHSRSLHHGQWRH